MDEAIWEKLPFIVEILGLFAKKMEYLQKENISLADVFGVWLELESRLTKIGNSPLVKVFWEKLMHRKAEMNITSNEVTLSNMFLDLRFHFTLTTEQKELAKKHLIYLWEKINSKQDKPEREQPISPGMEEKETENDDSEDMLEQIMRELESSQHIGAAIAPRSTDDCILQEIQNFCKMGRAKATENIIIKWETDKFSFPILYELARTIMAVAPTEVSVERNFSALDFILTKRRNRLTDENLEMILLIKLNHSLFYESFGNGELAFD